MTHDDVYAYTESILRVARTLAAGHAAEICIDPAISATRKATRLNAVRSWCAEIPEIVEIVDSIVTGHAPELCEGDDPLYRLTS